jgi:antitoxin Phd
MQWQLQQAKNQLSRVVQAAQEEGPQVITVHGKEMAVLLSIEEYLRLGAQKENLADFLRDSPLQGSGLVIERDCDPGREIEL